MSKSEITILSRTSPCLFSFYIVHHLPYVKDFDSLLSDNKRTVKSALPRDFWALLDYAQHSLLTPIISSLEGIPVLTSPSQVTLIYNIQTTSDK